jgi:hypothetical protein|uniref:WLM domain-containing protein n=1 Tax=viral metagenome TaxID=1070528 RepID=A0A6C0IZ79_9ZZZZ
MEEILPSLIIILCVIIVPTIAIIYLISKHKHEQFLMADPKLNKLVDKFHTFFIKDKIWQYPLEKLNNKNIMQKITFCRGEKSYTLNKEVVYICLKDDYGEYYDENMLIYVIAHEIAHVLCPEVGHTDLFFEINEILLNELEKESIYNSSLPVIRSYCENGDPEL